jgi:hypothetical protein
MYERAGCEELLMQKSSPAAVADCLARVPQPLIRHVPAIAQQLVSFILRDHLGLASVCYSIISHPAPFATVAPG